MKRKQKRFLQMTLLFVVTLIFLPNIGLWSLYREKHLVKSAELGEQQPMAVSTWLTLFWKTAKSHMKLHKKMLLSREITREDAVFRNKVNKSTLGRLTERLSQAIEKVLLTQ